MIEVVINISSFQSKSMRPLINGAIKNAVNAPKML